MAEPVQLRLGGPYRILFERNQELEAALRASEARLAEEKATHESLRREHAVVDDQLRAIMGELSAACEEREGLRALADRVRDSHAALASRSATLESALEDATRDNGVLRSALERAQAEVDSLRVRLRATTEQNSELNAHLDLRSQEVRV